MYRPRVDPTILQEGATEQRGYVMVRGRTAWLRHHNARDKIWRLVDAKDQVLGRLASQIATVLIGKNKPTYLDNMDCGDPVVVINADKFTLTGRKWKNKHYKSFSGYPSGLKEVPVTHVLEKRPADAIYLAVKRMLPTNKLRRVRLDNLFIYMGEDHPHKAQRPALLPPCHLGSRLGTGGAPTEEELETWWINLITQTPQKSKRAIPENH